MALKFESHYRATRLDGLMARSNAVYQDVDIRLHRLEVAGADADEAVSAIIARGTVAIAENIAPLVAEAQALLDGVSGGVSADLVQETPARRFTSNTEIGGLQTAITANQDALATKANAASLGAHTGATGNPHQVTAAQVGAYTKSEADAALQAAVNTHTHTTADLPMAAPADLTADPLPTDRLASLADVATIARANGVETGLILRLAVSLSDISNQREPWPNGFADAFETAGGVDATASAGLGVSERALWSVPENVVPLMEDVQSAQGVTITGSSFLHSSASRIDYWPSNAFEGNYSLRPNSSFRYTQWVSISSGDEWVRVDFGGSPRSLRGWQVDNSSPAEQRSYRLEGSNNGSSWTQYDRVTLGFGQTVRRFFPPSSTHRYWRIFAEGNGIDPVTMREAEFYEAQLGTLVGQLTPFGAAEVPTRASVAVAIRDLLDVPMDVAQDLTVRLSRDGGVTWASTQQFDALGQIEPGVRLIEAAAIDLSGQPPGTDIVARFEFPADHVIQILDVVVRWSA